MSDLNYPINSECAEALLSEIGDGNLGYRSGIEDFNNFIETIFNGLSESSKLEFIKSYNKFIKN